MNLSEVNYLLALGTVGLQVSTAALVLAFVMRKRVPAFERVVAAVGDRGLWVGLLATFGAALVNAYYNEVLGIPPCDLCWWGRIFLYPQIVLLGMAAWKRDFYVAEYAIVLSVVGAGISAYHHMLQLFPNSLPCPSTGVSCAQRFLFEFGYITYPLMAFSLFAFLIVTMLLVRCRRAA